MHKLYTSMYITINNNMLNQQHLFEKRTLGTSFSIFLY